jgi:hypothetical protein
MDPEGSAYWNPGPNLIRRRLHLYNMSPCFYYLFNLSFVLCAGLNLFALPIRSRKNYLGKNGLLHKYNLLSGWYGWGLWCSAIIKEADVCVYKHIIIIVYYKKSGIFYLPNIA